MLRARGRIAAIHVCDWLVPTTDLVFDHAMPGEGAIDIPRIRATAEPAGYGGVSECEVVSYPLS